MRLPQESVVGEHSEYIRETLSPTSTGSGQEGAPLPHASPTVRIPVNGPIDPENGLGRAASLLDAELRDEELEVEGRRSRSRQRSVSGVPHHGSEALDLEELDTSLAALSSSPNKGHGPTTVDDVRAAPLSPLKRTGSISMIPSVFGDVEDRPIPSKSDPSRMSMPAIIPGLASKESLAAILSQDDEDLSYDQDL